MFPEVRPELIQIIRKGHINHNAKLFDYNIYNIQHSKGSTIQIYGWNILLLQRKYLMKVLSKSE